MQVLIETYWNVNAYATAGIILDIGLNRNILECK